MAYDANILNDEDDELKQQSSGGLITGSGPGASAQAQSRSSDGTGEYTPLEKYLDANRDRHQGEQLAGKIGEDLGRAEQAQSSLGDEFRKKSDEGTVSTNQGVLDQVAYDPTSVVRGRTNTAPNSQAPATINNLSENGETGATDNPYDKFVGMRDAKYSGPSLIEDLDNYASARNDTTRGKERAEQSKTETGKTALLDNYYSRPTYTQGEKALDQYLVSNDDRAPEAFSRVQERGGALEPGWEHLSEDTRAYGAAAKAKTDAAREAARGTLDAATGSRKSKIDDTVARRRAEYDNTVVPIQSALQSGDLSGLPPDVIEALGVVGGNNYGVDPSTYFSSVSRDDINPSTVATSKDYDELNALAELAGIDNSYLTAPERAGTMDDEPLYNFRKDDYRSALDSARTSFMNDYDAVKKRIAEINDEIYNAEVFAQKYPDHPVKPTVSSATYAEKETLLKRLTELEKALAENKSIGGAPTPLKEINNPSDLPILNGSPGTKPSNVIDDVHDIPILRDRLFK